MTVYPAIKAIAPSENQVCRYRGQNDAEAWKLPDRVSVKIAISVAPELNQALVDYAALYAETYGQQEPISELLPAMLTSFLESDRAFSKRIKR